MAALRNVVEYLRKDERDDFESNPTHQHIYIDVLKLDAYLDIHG